MLPYTDVMILGANHSILASNVSGNKNTPEFVQKFFELAKTDKKSLDSFGLFGGSNNYHTYYPEAKPEDTNPKDEEFIEPMFRMLSNCIVAKGYNPTEFPVDVLKESMPLLIGQTVNCDHETDVANAIGSVKEVFWQEAYKTTDGIEIPAGINAVLKIDGKSNPRIARGINMDPPSIHSNSVTVQFEWKPSHQFEKEWEFYDKLGTIAEDGTMVRRIATKIIAYRETSLVSHGADPFAQKIKDGKIVNPGYAGAVYSAFKDETPTEKGLQDIQGDIDFKNIGIMHNTSSISNIGNKSQTISNTEMNKELQEFLEKLFGENMLSLADGATPTAEVAISAVQSILQEKQSLSEAKASLEEKLATSSKEVEQWKEKAEANAKMAKVGTDYLTDLREKTVQAYSKVFGKEVDENIVSLINAETTNRETLLSLKASYEAQLEEKFPLKCAECGSTHIDRSSSIQENEDKNDKGIDSLSDSISKIANANRRK